MIVSEQLVSLGQRRQSAMTRAMSCTSLLDARASLSQPGWQNPPMRGDELRELQAPLKERYRAEPDAASITLRAAGTLDEGVSCSVQTGRALATAGLHPLTGGDRGAPVLGRHAARGAGGVRRGDAARGGHC